MYGCDYRGHCISYAPRHRNLRLGITPSLRCASNVRLKAFPNTFQVSSTVRTASWQKPGVEKKMISMCKLIWLAEIEVTLTLAKSLIRHCVRMAPTWLA